MLDTLDYHRLDAHTNYQINVKHTRRMQANAPPPNEPCRVCGFNQNTGRNFGVITCSTCKAFFRRNGRHSSSLPPCRFGGCCLVNERTRRQCPACRLAKCFAMGMQKDLIRTEAERAARLQLVRANRLQHHKKSHLQSSSQTNQKYSSIPKSSVRTLSSNDWIQLTNIHGAYEQFCLFPILRAEDEREEYLNTLPIKCRLKEHSFLNVLRIRLTSLSAFFRATVPVFSMEMNSHDRQWLIRTNLRYLFIFSSMDLMNINGNQLHFDSKKACYHVYLYVYGSDIVTRGDYLIHRLKHCISFDPVISKLMQIILFLSPCLVTNYFSLITSYQPSLKTILQINHSQEQYTEIFWSYLVHRYGEIAAQKLFISVIGQVLQQQQYGADMDQCLIERQPFGNLVYSLLTTFSVD